ncbi:type I secretion system permease/ATPase [Amylibacter sp.]|nr:type I secretion system permease/ATPase [Amylibacter sp.]
MSTENNDLSSENQDSNVTISENLKQKEKSLVDQDSYIDEKQINPHDKENSLISAVQMLIKINGAEFSIGAIRDLGDVEISLYDAKSAVSTLSNLGYQSNFGKIKVKKLKPSHCPCISFNKEGYAVVIESISEKGFARVNYLSDTINEEDISLKDLRQIITGYFIFARKSISVQKGKNDWFWGSFSQSKLLYFQVIIAASLTNFLGLSSSIFIMVVYDRVVPNEAIESLIALTIGVLIAMSFEFLIKTLRALFVDRASKKADQRMSRLIFDKILNLRLDTGSKKSGALASVVREFDTLREFFTSATLIAVVDLPFVFFFIYIISLIAGPLALVPLVAVPMVIFCGLIVQPFLAKLAAGSMQTNMSKQAILVETLTGLETVQATGCGKLMRKRFSEASVAQSDFSLKSRMYSQFAINSSATIQQLAQVATIFFGVFLIQDGTITMGAMIASVILGGRTLAPLSQLASAMSRANSARQAHRSLSELMRDDPSFSKTDEVKLSRPNLEGAIELKNVSYSFPGSKTPIIRDLSLKIPAGQKVAILGKMGSGKTTFSRLLSGLIEPTEGAIMIDGVDIRQIDPSDMHRNVGVMLQKTWLFSGTVKENLQIGYYEYGDDHLLNIARISGVDDFVSQSQSGYDLMLGEGGQGLSGGQLQSINLARAMLHDPNVLILDEPTSSMDSGTEKIVISKLKNWMKKRTLIMVTHRNSILELADRVLVIDDGSVLMDTTPERLKAQSGRGV